MKIKFVLQYYSLLCAYVYCCGFKVSCFNAVVTQILNLEYNAASFRAWMFLQRTIYGIKSRWDVPSPKAAEVATALGLRLSVTMLHFIVYVVDFSV